MNKIIKTIFIFQLFLNICLYGQNQAVNTYLLNGIAGNYFIQDSYGDFKIKKKVGTVPIEEQVPDLYNSTKLIRDKVLIGHSLGGLKAVAYANHMSLKGQSSEVKGVITIGAPLQGFYGLKNGKNELSNKISKYIEILSNGGKSIVNCLAPLPKIYDFIQSGFIKSLVPNPLEIFGTSDPVNTALVPDSRFLSEYVKANEKIIKAGYSEQKKKIVRYTYVKSKNQPWWSIFILSAIQYDKVPVYENYTVTYPAVVQYTPKMNKDIYVGMIVGQNNDFDEFYSTILNYSILNSDFKVFGGIDKNTFIQRREMLTKGCEVAQNAHFAACFLVPVFSWFYWEQSINALNAHTFLRDYNKNMANLVGSSQSDCFIAEDSQQYSIDKLGGRPIGKNNQYVYNIPNGIHDSNTTNSETVNPKIWGTGGRGITYNYTNGTAQPGAITKDGAIGSMYDARGWKLP